MKYAFFDANGRVESAHNDDTVNSLPNDAVELTEEQWYSRFDLKLVAGKLTIDPIPVQVKNSIINRISALQGLLALDQSGLSAQYETWANDTSRTFAEKAFINKAITWYRDDPVLASAATALGLTKAQVDSMFELAATL